MTLDETINKHIRIAKENQKVVDTGIVFDDVTIDMLYCDDTEVIEEHLANYEKCAEEHRQLSKWLKDYKRLKEKEKPEMIIYTADGYADGQLVYDMAECPNCGMHYEESDQFWEADYCLNCGQALKWEDENG